MFYNKVIRRLRERGEPIRLFGETDNETCLRLRFYNSLLLIKYYFILQTNRNSCTRSEQGI